MCFGGSKIPQDNSAELARQREEAREARIREGRGSIDEAFLRYDDPYFSGIQSDYEDFYFPQVDDQYRDTQKKLTLNLARTGNLNAGSGASQLGDLKKAYDLQRMSFGNQALDATNQYRREIEGTKDDLYAQNRSAADPAAIATQAISRAGSYDIPPSPSPIGQLFAQFLNTAALGVAAEKRGFPGLRTGLFPLKNDAQTIVN